MKNNQDLIWCLENNNKDFSSVRFLKYLESALCLFSSSLKQLYSNYEIVGNKDSSRMVALPNPYAFHDTYDDIIADAIIPTGIHITPSKGFSETSTELSILYRSKDSGKIKSVNIRNGLKAIQKKYPLDTFLPVMTTSDLKLINGKLPSLHMHRLDLDKLENLSPFQKTDIKNVIKEKMSTMIA